MWKKTNQREETQKLRKRGQSFLYVTYYLELIHFAINTPGKLSQVPPRRYRLNGCNRYPELPVMVKN